MGRLTGSAIYVLSASGISLPAFLQFSMELMMRRTFIYLLALPVLAVSTASRAQISDPTSSNIGAGCVFLTSSHPFCEGVQ